MSKQITRWYMPVTIHWYLQIKIASVFPPSSHTLTNVIPYTFKLYPKINLFNTYIYIYIYTRK